MCVRARACSCVCVYIFVCVCVVDELQEKTLENSNQREEVIGLKQEAQLLRRDVLISGWARIPNHRDP